MSRNELRFVVCDEEKSLRAATWKLWTPKFKKDIYLACRQLGGQIKMSFHESGSWQFGFSKEGFENIVDTTVNPQRSRHAEIWDRPAPVVAGVTLALRIITPYSAVVAPIEESEKAIVRIPNCPEGMATEIDILISTKHDDLSDWPGKNSMGTNFVGSYPVGNDEQVWVVYQQVPLPDMPASGQGTVMYFKGKSKADILNAENLKAIGFILGEDNSKILLDTLIIPAIKL